jgi:hypothetical protein
MAQVGAHITLGVVADRQGDVDTAVAEGEKHSATHGSLAMKFFAGPGLPGTERRRKHGGRA